MAANDWLQAQKTQPEGDHMQVIIQVSFLFGDNDR